MQGTAVSINLPGLSASLTTDEPSTTSSTVDIPSPMRNTSHTTGPDYRIINQKYLPGGQTVPLNVTGAVKMSDLAGTYGRKPAMAKGMPMPDNTGVSLYANVVTVLSHQLEVLLSFSLTGTILSFLSPLTGIIPSLLTGTFLSILSEQANRISSKPDALPAFQ